MIQITHLLFIIFLLNTLSIATSQNQKHDYISQLPIHLKRQHFHFLQKYCDKYFVENSQQLLIYTINILNMIILFLIFMMPKCNNLRQFQSSLNKPQINLNIMVRSILTHQFNHQQWSQISSYNSKQFLAMQESIMDNLLSNIDLFEKYFDNFYHNHSKLYYWASSNKSKKLDIKSYVFKKILNENLPAYHQKINKLLQAIANRQGQSQMRKERSEKINKYSQEIFTMLSSKGIKKSKVIQKKKANASLFQKEKYFEKVFKNPQKNKTFRDFKEIQKKLKDKSESLAANPQKRSYDFHQLYLKTFHACDGLKYIYYNYEKHMKGLEQKGKYNDFIRGNPKKQQSTSLTPNQFKELSQQYKTLQSDGKDQQFRNTTYQYRPIGSGLKYSDDYSHNRHEKKQGHHRNRSQIIFRSLKTKNNGKFIRKTRAL